MIFPSWSIFNRVRKCLFIIKEWSLILGYHCELWKNTFTAINCLFFYKLQFPVWRSLYYRSGRHYTQRLKLSVFIGAWGWGDQWGFYRLARPSCLENFDATVYDHLGARSNDTSACEISQAHQADLLNIPKFIYILRNNHRIKNLKTPLKSL